MSATPNVSSTGFLSVEARIASLRAVFNLPDAHIVPVLVGNHLLCRLDPACGWLCKFENASAAPAIFEEHIRTHVEADARYLRELRYSGPSMPGVLPITAVRTCTWRGCGQNFQGGERLVEHIMHVHGDIAVATHCPLCVALIGVATREEMESASMNDDRHRQDINSMLQYLLLNHYESGQCKGLVSPQLTTRDIHSHAMIED
ncbi:hypothetical protein BD626DRAFT_586112 [Schizophyllum amplum]|uniref:C2H2-type domain-containing protein n=1 Tax=Schizophyllum amplum TaxID=97359 RepID=A0A550C0Y3_9AGAR|nr:hypothetical protein BD626DRAFT_586112 [Auriculariopsis ampla]